MINLEEAKKLLAAHDQEHVLRNFELLGDAEKKELLCQIENLDFELVESVKHHDKQKTGVVEPLQAIDLDTIRENKDSYKKTGMKVLQEGRFACVLLAGGMGTRLGLDKPKGELDFGITRSHYLFQKLVENLLQVKKEAEGASIPLFVMTSEKNDDDTRSFFKEHEFFGYPEDDVFFFVQEMAAAVDYNGKLLMEEPGRLATSPNGNGGWFSSLVKAGYLQELHKRNVEWINIFSVDNPLQKMADPVFIGATILNGADSGSKVVRKAYPEEKMGVMCREDGRSSVIEYYELSDEMRNAADKNGTLLYGFGVILNYIFKLDKLEELLSKKLPCHIVEKKIPYVDQNNKFISPEEPNGYKFETLAVDVIRLMDYCVPFEVEREREFAPIKNLHGKDSLDSARELLKLNGEIL
jgi:UDP-N-acetylglucosamine/UDP-N-acetylgalactosamine diphosphorylase